jgi:L-seryl-tRNA(Ser) seleniumtransferase
MTADARRRLPSVEALTAEVERRLTDTAAESIDRKTLTRLARARLETSREGGDADPAAHPLEVEAIAAELAASAVSLLQGNLHRVINATGVLLQTNLGRAPLSEAALARLQLIGGGYSDLEYDLAAGRRGERSISLSATFEAILGVPAVVVNNNAASLMLALTTLARGREVIVSRGELIEIGGSFRLPDVMRLSGARLVEVGTTNRTRVADYADAITPRTAMLLKVHTSNYQVVGFVEAAPPAELATLAHQRGLVLMEDLGSGSLLATDAAGLAHEPTVQEALASGADLVAFSGDKLLGGPQAGIVAGRRDLVTRLARNALYRALRPDKLTLAALDATLGAYLRGVAETELPLWRMLAESPAGTRKRAAAWADAVAAAVPGAACEVVEVESAVGGGSLPGQVLRGFGLAVGGAGSKPSATTLARRLRLGRPPVIGRVQDRRLLLDPRTVASADDNAEVAAALVAALRG